MQSFHFATGVTQVDFGQDISHCAAIASIGAVPIYASPGSSTGRLPGYALADTSSAGSTDTGSGFPSGDSVTVETFGGTSDALADTSFDLAVFC